MLNFSRVVFSRTIKNWSSESCFCHKVDKWFSDVAKLHIESYCKTKQPLVDKYLKTKGLEIPSVEKRPSNRALRATLRTMVWFQISSPYRMLRGAGVGVGMLTGALAQGWESVCGGCLALT